MSGRRCRDELNTHGNVRAAPLTAKNSNSKPQGGRNRGDCPGPWIPGRLWKPKMFSGNFGSNSSGSKPVRSFPPFIYATFPLNVNLHTLTAVAADREVRPPNPTGVGLDQGMSLISIMFQIPKDVCPRGLVDCTGRCRTRQEETNLDLIMKPMKPTVA